jgi:hypothetical protein
MQASTDLGRPEHPMVSGSEEGYVGIDGGLTAVSWGMQVSTDLGRPERGGVYAGIDGLGTTGASWGIGE